MLSSYFIMQRMHALGKLLCRTAKPSLMSESTIQKLVCCDIAVFTPCSYLAATRVTMECPFTVGLCGWTGQWHREDLAQSPGRSAVCFKEGCYHPAQRDGPAACCSPAAAPRDRKDFVGLDKKGIVVQCLSQCSHRSSLHHPSENVPKIIAAVSLFIVHLNLQQRNTLGVGTWSCRGSRQDELQKMSACS